MIPDSWRRAALSPPAAWGEPLAPGVLRASPEDFAVRERLGFEASGDGPHALLCVRKRGANTEWVARELARVMGCKPFDVGFAGLKDRHAVTTQYFTVPRGRRSAAELTGLKGEGYEVLSSLEHLRKLPRGALEGNDFAITVRDFRCDPAALAERMQHLASGGAPNYFGPQRFGREAGNLEAVIRSAGEGGPSPGERRGRRRDDQRGFMLSAARSLVFNAIVAERVERGTWNKLMPGDVANLDGRGSVFPVEAVDETLSARCAGLEIHPTAPLPGEGEPLSTGEVRAHEEAVAARYPEALAVMRAVRMNSERRATRIRISALECDYDGSMLRLQFGLGAGSFATTVLREIVAGVDGE
jgi:tRNA pseudouridine13 synthase